MNKSPTFLAIGDLASDTFIRIKDANVHCKLNREECEICLRFGDKVPYDFTKTCRSVGNSPNAATAIAKLGFPSALISDVGDDDIGKESLGVLKQNGVNIDHVRMHKGLTSNSHYVLWYDTERTILVKHEKYEYAMPKLGVAPDWIYLSSIGGDDVKYHNEILKYLNENPEVKLVFQPGTFQINMGVNELAGIYKRTEIFFSNVQEAEKILNKKPKTEIKELLSGIMALGPKIVFITDGEEGAYAYDGKEYLFVPIFPGGAYERTGAGDSFSATATVAIAIGKTVREALSWGPINSQSVIKYVGAQEGLLSMEQLLENLKNAPAEYQVKTI